MKTTNCKLAALGKTMCTGQLRRFMIAAQSINVRSHLSLEQGRSMPVLASAARFAATVFSLTAFAAAPAWAASDTPIKVGIDLSSTGPAAAIGITSKNAMLMWPATLGGHPAQYTILDDGSD